MRKLLLVMCSVVVVGRAGAASAVEIALEFNQPPVVSTENVGGGYNTATFAAGGIDVAMHASGAGYAEIDGYDSFWNTSNYLECGNTVCHDFVATFSIELSTVAVDFAGARNNWSGDAILSSTFYLHAYSGENGTGTLLGSASVPDMPATLPFAQGYIEPVTLSVVGPAIRSIVFGGLTIDDEEPGNMTRVDRIRMTVVPEPASGLLTGLGLVALASARAPRRGSFG